MEQQEYYANPQNSFWKILFTIYNMRYSPNYAMKKQLIIANQLAVWDVCSSAKRLGSLDSAIKNETPNNIIELLTQNPSIEKIVFNGQKATILYDKYFQRIPKIKYSTLLSTSPANARFNFHEKLDNWRQTIK